METVVLVVHLLIAVCLIATVLIQRSEGGALGIGGGGGGGISSRGQTTPMAKVTWGLAAAFITTSITLAVMAGGDRPGSSVLDNVGGGSPSAPGILLPDLPPPADDTEGAAVPPAAESGPELSLPPLVPTAPSGDAGGTGTRTAPVAPPTAD